MKHNLFKSTMFALTATTALSLSSCHYYLGDLPEPEQPEKENLTGIPDDSQATPNPTIDTPTPGVTVPNPQTTVEWINGVPVIRLNMTGINGGGSGSGSGGSGSGGGSASGAYWLKLYGTGSDEQNVWVEVDGQPKGIDVYNHSDQEEGRSLKADIVFTVDNSGSMYEEADAVARDIESWAQLLVDNQLDARFGIVGYDGRITGAINLTDVTALKEFLNHSSGTSRTMHFGGPDASTLSQKANDYFVNSYMDECGAAAIHYANDLYDFRNGANRIYVNFTDEPNYPCNKSKYSVKFFEDQNNWPAAKGTVHTVYSSPKFDNNNWNQEEQPWLISEYTGGTTIFAPYDFTGVTLENLPVTGAMENSYIIRFTNIDELLDGKPHEVHITIISKDGTVKIEKVFYIIFGTAE